MNNNQRKSTTSSHGGSFLDISLDFCCTEDIKQDSKPTPADLPQEGHNHEINNVLTGKQASDRRSQSATLPAYHEIYPAPTSIPTSATNTNQASYYPQSSTLTTNHHHQSGLPNQYCQYHDCSTKQQNAPFQNYHNTNQNPYPMPDTNQCCFHRQSGLPTQPPGTNHYCHHTQYPTLTPFPTNYPPPPTSGVCPLNTTTTSGVSFKSTPIYSSNYSPYMVNQTVYLPASKPIVTINNPTQWAIIRLGVVSALIGLAIFGTTIATMAILEELPAANLAVGLVTGVVSAFYGFATCSFANAGQTMHGKVSISINCVLIVLVVTAFSVTVSSAGISEIGIVVCALLMAVQALLWLAIIVLRINFASKRR